MLEKIEVNIVVNGEEKEGWLTFGSKKELKLFAKNLDSFIKNQEIWNPLR